MMVRTTGASLSLQDFDYCRIVVKKRVTEVYGSKDCLVA